MVAPTLPNDALICATIACTSGGWVSPAMTMPWPAWARRSCAAAQTQLVALCGTSPPAPPAPTSAASAAASSRDLVPGDRHAMVGIGTGDARGWLRRIEAAHGCALGFFDPAPGGKIARVPQRCRMLRKKIRVERDDHFRFREIVNRFRAEDAAGARFAQSVAGERLPLMPPGAGKLFNDRLELGGQRRRGHILGKEAEACSARLRRERLVERFEKNSPGRDRIAIR